MEVVVDEDVIGRGQNPRRGVAGEQALEAALQQVSKRAALPTTPVGIAAGGALGGARFFSELYALRFVDASTLTVAAACSSGIYVAIYAVVFPHIHFASGVVIPSITWTKAGPGLPLFVFGFLLTTLGIVCYGLTVQYYGPDNIVVHRCGRGCNAYPTSVDCFLGCLPAPLRASLRPRWERYLARGWRSLCEPLDPTTAESSPDRESRLCCFAHCLLPRGREPRAQVGDGGDSTSKEA